ncbi:MAG: hypothetical protein H6970_04745 [Gammaproteobacteria bacterium]|nr:hypothetical protein [Gammaproteobacteria bacterium]MCP5424357.1 hypothetical protein [Gammaproteobacteria bacterium]MCP5459108.1 hypothetical protein [Gammaproteobacteria bacterium]
MLLSLFSVVALPQDPDPLVVITSPDVVQQSLSPNALRAIFGMRLRSWPSGKPIQVFVLNETNPVHIQFCKQVLNIFPHQLRSSWDRQVYSGTGQAPREVESMEEMLAQVAATPGAIGYSERSRIDDSVRVLPIQ